MIKEDDINIAEVIARRYRSAVDDAEKRKLQLFRETAVYYNSILRYAGIENQQVTEIFGLKISENFF